MYNFCYCRKYFLKSALPTISPPKSSLRTPTTSLLTSGESASSCFSVFMGTLLSLTKIQLKCAVM